MDYLDKLTQLAQVRGEINIRCLFQGEGQIDQRNDECADHIQNEQPPMGLEIGQEDPQCGLLLIVFGGHGKLLSAGN